MNLMCILLKEFNGRELSELKRKVCWENLSSSVVLDLPLTLMGVLPTKFFMAWALCNLDHPFWDKLREIMILGILPFHSHSLTVNKNIGEAWWQQYQVENVTSTSLEMKTGAASKCSGIEILKLNPTSNTVL